jgi:hypothetical protein
MNPNKTDTIFRKNLFSPENNQELIKSWDQNNRIISIISHQVSNKNQLVEIFF